MKPRLGQNHIREGQLALLSNPGTLVSISPPYFAEPFFSFASRIISPRYRLRVSIDESCLSVVKTEDATD